MWPSRWSWRVRPPTWVSSAPIPDFRDTSTPRSTRPHVRKRTPRPSSDLKKGLPAAQLRRFQALRDRCLALRQIAEQLREPAGADSIRSLDELQLSDLDRLLWIYLRMLYTQHMLERFFENTSGDQIQAEIRRLEDRIRRLEKEPDSANRSRIRQSLQANLETCRSRLANLDKARRTTNCFRPRSKTWKRRSSRSPSWRSTAAMPKRSPARSSRSPRA